MFCPKCDGDTRVADSRRVETLVARKRVCKSCGYSFYTEETEVESNDALRFYYSQTQAKYRKKEVSNE